MPPHRSPADQAIYAAFREAFSKAGMSRSDFQAAVTWVGEQTNSGRALSPQDWRQGFAAFAESRGIEARRIDPIVNVYETGVARGPEAIAPRYDRYADERMISDAEARMKQDPNAYFSDHDLQERLGEALERRQAEQGDADSPSEQRRSEAPSRDETRRAEIELMMRTDGGRAYWASPRVQSEYGAILSGQVADGDTTTDPGAQPVDTGAAERPSDGSTVNGW